MADCRSCGKCCKYIAIELDEPNDKEDFENLVWYLMHENVHIYIDDEDSWIIEFKTKCKGLTENNMCNVHKHRPDICRDHDPESCVSSGTEGNGEKISFNSVQDLKKYFELKKFDFEVNFPDEY